MTSYRYLGYGTTDANGVAHLTKNASGQDVNGYVGTGAGEVDVIASLDNPITSSSIVSETYSIWDYLCYDGGVTGDKSSDWTTPSDMTVETDATGTEITSTANYKYYTSTKALTGNYEVLLEVKTDGGCRLGFYNSSQYDLWSIDTSNAWNYVKLRVENGTLTAQRSANGTQWVNLSAVGSTITASTRYFELSNAYSTSTLVYKNLKIYPI